MSKKKHEHVSKFLSFVLRHNPQAIGIQLDSQGWADLDELLQGAMDHGHDLKLEEILEVVANSEKQRFSLSENRRQIRANQGHSTNTVAIQHERKEPPALLYHGTAERFLEPIGKEGLVPGTRHHVHLSTDHLTAIEVGKRYGKPVLLEVNAAQMHRQGFVFFQAENGVWLTDHVPAVFLTIRTLERAAE